MKPRRRYLTFSLRTLFILLAVLATGLGWTIERARQRGKANDAIIQAGGVVSYDNEPYLLQDKCSSFSRIWTDCKREPVTIAFGPHTRLDASLGKQLSAIGEITSLWFDHPSFNDAELRHLHRIDDDACIVFDEPTGRITTRYRSTSRAFTKLNYSSHGIMSR
jgi:hypothetical protein